jgi:uncharacterized protein
MSGLRITLASYVALCLLLIGMESRLVYHPPLPRQVLQEAQLLGGEEVWFTAPDETKLHGWFFPRENAPYAILYFHGNGEDADLNIDLAARLRDRLQASVFIFDYRGYGHSGGSPYEDGVVSDGIAAQRWLAERLKIEPKEIILYGRSLGGGVAIAAAAELGARAVIVHGTFANMVDVAASRYPFVPVRSLMRNPYRSQQRIANYQGPFLQFHGTRDVVVPMELAKPLCEAVPSASKQFVEIDGGGHNDPLPEYCLVVLMEFLDSLPTPSSGMALPGSATNQ